MLKKWLCLFSAALLMLNGLVFARAQGEMTTTVMVYLCGADLETTDRSASADLREMIASGIAADGPVKVIVETGGAEKWHMRAVDSNVNMRFEVNESGLKEVQRLSGTRNMGAASTLKDFISFCVTRYPADRYFLILWDHGGGPLDGICFDELYDDDGLTMAELTEALQGGLRGNKLDAVIFDACLMGTWEVAGVMQPFADYMGASEDSEPGEGLNYNTWLSKLNADPAISTHDLLETVSDSLVDTISKSAPNSNVTFSILDLRQLDGLTAALNGLGRAMSRLMSESAFVLTTARESVLSFGEYEEDEEEAFATDLVDIRVVCDLLASALPEETAAVRDALERVVLFNDVSAPMTSHAYGLSMFWPAYTVSDYPEYLTDYPAVAAGSAWSDFAVAYGRDHAVSYGFHMYAGSNHNSSTQGNMWSNWWSRLDEDDTPAQSSHPSYDDDTSGWNISGGGLWNVPQDHTGNGYETDEGHYTGLWSDLPGYTGTAGREIEGVYPGLWSDLSGSVGDGSTDQAGNFVSPGENSTYHGLWEDLR